jgi:hypothetical protein
MSFMYHRGVHVIDRISGFKGVITCRMDSITGCNRYLVEPQVDKDGKKIEAWWLDEHCLEVDPDKQQLKLDRRVDQPPG